MNAPTSEPLRKTQSNQTETGASNNAERYLDHHVRLPARGGLGERAIMVLLIIGGGRYFSFDNYIGLLTRRG